ncbi:MAG: acetyl-CoA hydrolase/transferase C-terminal domain-containing protein [Chloroflexota bacterium]|nr:acetyl-CoA hydrolase/transferase C-terminal domain-containing protein [Chloroflexota bacterium]
MNDYRAEYRRKLITADEAAGLVKSGMSIDYGAICGFPWLIDEKLTQRAPELEKVIIRAENSRTHIPEVDPNQEHFIYNSWFFSKMERDYGDQGCCSPIPFNLGEGPRMYREWLKDDVDIVFVEVTPMNEYGYFNFGVAITRQKAMCDVAKTVVVEVNESQPWVPGGYDEAVHISQVDYIVENDKYPIAEFPPVPPTQADEQIARYIAELVEDGATLQLGIGAMPNIVGQLLIESGVKDLGIHTEMINESIMHLIETGVVTGRRKSLNPGKAVHCFAGGTRQLYRFMDHNPLLAGFPVDYTNNPYIIAQNVKQVAINSALKIDLRGQVCSEAAGQRQISGTGGQMEFTRGAYMAPGGKAFICLRATHRDKGGKLVSNIVPGLEAGDVVTVPATEVSHVVTEFGVVNLKSRSLWQRARLLISIAHPDFRDGLEAAAYQAKLITRGTRDC